MINVKKDMAEQQRVALETLSEYTSFFIYDMIDAGDYHF
jgi:hypothetical protein